MGKLVVRGTRHEGNIRDVTLPGFGLGGAQCTMMALAALIFASQVMQPDCWTGDIVDEVLMYGDHLYSHLIDTQFQGNHSTYIGHYQIPGTVGLFGSAYHAAVQKNTFFGFVGGSLHNDIGTVSVAEALHMSLTLSTMVLVTIGDESFSFFYIVIQLVFTCLIHMLVKVKDWLIFWQMCMEKWDLNFLLLRLPTVIIAMRRVNPL